MSKKLTSTSNFNVHQTSRGKNITLECTKKGKWYGKSKSLPILWVDLTIDEIDSRGGKHKIPVSSKELGKITPYLPKISTERAGSTLVSILTTYFMDLSGSPILESEPFDENLYVTDFLVIPKEYDVVDVGKVHQLKILRAFSKEKVKFEDASKALYDGFLWVNTKMYIKK